MVTAALLMVVPSYNSAAASSILRRTMEDEDHCRGLRMDKREGRDRARYMGENGQTV
jgi:hypothetical protein